MKKLFSLAMLAAMLLTACVKQEKFSDEIGDKTTLTFTVGTGQIATRAAVDPVKGDATRLWVGVYYKNGTDEYVHMDALDKNVSVQTWPTTVSIDVARNETYKLVFWADNITDAEAFTINKETGILNESSTTKDGNLINRDAYYKMIEITPAGSISGEVTLVRPMAQINIGTSDLAAFKAASMYEGTVKTKVVVEGVATAMNLLTGEASGEAGTVTFDYAAERAAEITADGVNYDYLVLNYVLAPVAATAKATVRLSKDGSTDINAFEVSNLPVKPNYRTNIVGKLLTGTATYTVNVDQNFEGDLDKKVGPVFSSIEALNEYFTTLKGNADKGDIDPEEVTVTAIGETSTIVLPKVKENIRILMPVVAKDAVITIAYADGATADEKPANLYLYVSNIKTLTADITSTHFELLTGSYVNTNAEVSTSDGTFVIQKGAKVGTVTVNKGNAKVEGEVNTVNVAAGASADGQGAPVQVFVASTAAVEQVNLAAKADVVVEQPKDNIEMGDHENKVAVTVAVSGCSAMAQNGGQIYVEIAAGVTCSVAADGESATEEASQITIASTGTGSSVSTFTSNGGEIDVTTHSEDIKGDVEEPAEGVAKIGGKMYATLTAAFAAAVPSDVVKILKNYDASNEPMSAGTRQFVINKSITIDGQGHTVHTKNRGFGVGNVNNNLSSNIDVTFKDITILNPTNSGRCIDTRGKIGVLTLDNVVLSTQGATGQYTQPLTIGGNQSDIASININNSTIQTNEDATAYYAIITFNPVNMTISNSTIKGWACIYAKGPDSSAGSAGSTFTVTSNSNLVSYNCYSGVSNAFSAVEIEDSNVTVDITDSNIAIHNSGDQTQSIFGFPDSTITDCYLSLIGNNIEFDNTGSGSCDLITNQGNNTLVYSDNIGLLVGGGASVTDDGDEF